MMYSLRRITNHEQPSLDEQPSATLGGNDFACSEQTFFTSQDEPPKEFKFWRCFTSDGIWKATQVNTAAWYWLKFYLPQPLILTKITLETDTNQPAKARLYGGASDAKYTLISNELILSEDTNLHELVLNANNVAYSYFKLEVQPKLVDEVSLKRVLFNGLRIEELGVNIVNEDKTLTQYMPNMTLENQ